MTFIMVDIEADGPMPMMKDMFVAFKHLRKTTHTHNPVDDARGNAEALLAMEEKPGHKTNLD